MYDCLLDHTNKVYERKSTTGMDNSYKGQNKMV